MTVEQTRTVLVAAELERACVQFLYREAELLDEADYTGWFDTCLSEDLEYLIPIRTTRERSSGVSEFSRQAYHMKDTYASLRLRVDRLLTEHAWAEDPPSRTRRVVTNVRVRELGPDEVEVKSYLTLHRSQWDTVDYDLLVAERQDVLRSEADEWRLRRREVLLNHTILGTANLGIFL
ncbi:aromatic-ring-hydroxylating dioxygenase subunit beta [Streptomyces sp. NPDC127079]|uniref:aromatic-ring-hydroxylating dioxygenase subunit beta n=1 Tax=Streptomyces sp. NPDC127079 TaxID=3347132 RepID=UPI003649B424